MHTMSNDNEKLRTDAFRFLLHKINTSKLENFRKYSSAYEISLKTLRQVNYCNHFNLHINMFIMHKNYKCERFWFKIVKFDPD